MTEPRIGIVCFDLGGVLVRICRSFAEACSAAGLDVRGACTEPHIEAARFEITDRYNAGHLTHDEWLHELARGMGGAYRPDELARIHDAWMLGEYEGVGDLIDELDAADVPTACLSNTNHAHWVRLVAEGNNRDEQPDPEFPVVLRLRRRYASHLLGWVKPDPAIYRAFERDTGYEPARILFFDDTHENVRAARRCGWNAEVIDPLGATAHELRQQLTRYGVL